MTARSVQARLQDTVVYLILTPHALAPEDPDGWRGPLESALASGCVGAVQLRLGGLAPERVASLACAVRDRVRALGPLFLINDDVELARRVDADGVHVGQDDMDPERARALLGPHRLVGSSTHDAGELARAHATSVDYVGLGPCFASTSKALVLEPRGAERLSDARIASATLPVFPIGGIDAGNVSQLVTAGARRAAVGAGILAAPDPAEAARSIHRALTT